MVCRPRLLLSNQIGDYPACAELSYQTRLVDTNKLEVFLAHRWRACSTCLALQLRLRGISSVTHGFVEPSVYASI